MIGRNLVYPLALLVSAFGLAASLPAQESGEPSDEMIVNGEPVTDGEIPFQVLVTAQWTDHGGSWTSTCGRSLIAPQWVLTAAHCLVRDGGAFAPGELVVGFGSVNRSKLRRIRVDKTFVHDGSIRCRRTTSVCKLKKPIPDAKTVEFASPTKEGLLRGSDQSPA